MATLKLFFISEAAAAFLTMEACSIAITVYDGAAHQPVLFHTKNRLEIIGIRCFPWTVFDLLGLPSGKDGVRIFEHPIAGFSPR